MIFTSYMFQVILFSPFWETNFFEFPNLDFQVSWRPQFYLHLKQISTGSSNYRQRTTFKTQTEDLSFFHAAFTDSKLALPSVNLSSALHPINLSNVCLLIASQIGSNV